MSKKHYDALFLPMHSNDAGAKTVADYLKKLLRALVIEQEGFSGKRPFGNSGWISDLAYPLVKAKYIKGKIYSEDEYVYADNYSNEELTKFVVKVVDQMYESLLDYRDLQDLETDK